MNKHIIKSDNKIKELQGGLKKDNLESKVRFDLIPYEVLERVAWHFTNGAKKYGTFNWKKASTKEQEHMFLEAALRHINKLYHEVNDGEDHAAASITNLMMYEWHTNHKK